MLSTIHVLSIFFTFVAAIIFIIIPSFYGEKIKDRYEEKSGYLLLMFMIFIMGVSIVLATLAYFK